MNPLNLKEPINSGTHHSKLKPQTLLSVSMDQNDLEKEEEPPVVMVVVPLPAQGHLNQLLHFSRLVSRHRIPVYFVGSATHNRQAKERVHGWELSSVSNIHFHDFPLPRFATPPPDPNAPNKWPTHLHPTFEAVLSFREPLAELLLSLSCTTRRVVVVHDSVMCFAAKEATSIPNGEAYSFQSCSAFAVLLFKWSHLGKPSLSGFKNLSEDLINLSIDGCISNDFLKFISKQRHLTEFDVGDLFNTCHPIEGQFIDMLAQNLFIGENKRQWAFGPLNPLAFDFNSASVRETTLAVSRHRCLEWLDKQPANSVLYVSFGTMTSISDEQIQEIALGLQHSEQRFIWSLRDADRGDVYADEDEVRRIELPEGYEENVEEIGMVVRDWAPQLQILAHGSTGGFLSHCGWNSCMESLSLGVPIAAWPMHSDQPMNTLLVTQVLKVGFVARQWEERHIVTSSPVIESAVRKLMASEDGHEVRKQAEELGISIRATVLEDGSSTAQFNSFLSHISRV